MALYEIRLFQATIRAKDENISLALSAPCSATLVHSNNLHPLALNPIAVLLMKRSLFSTSLSRAPDSPQEVQRSPLKLNNTKSSSERVCLSGNYFCSLLFVKMNNKLYNNNNNNNNILHV